MAKWNKESAHGDVKAFGENPKVRKKIRRVRILVALVILAIATIAAITAKPAYRKFRDMQIDRNLMDAQAAARLEDWSTARNLARSVLIARPGDFEAFRVWFRALSHADEPRTYMVAVSLFVHPNASREDRLDALGVLARQGPEAVAFSAYAGMDESMRREPAALVAISPLLIRRGQAAYVEQVLRNHADDSPPPDVSLEILRALCSAPSEDRVAEAREIFARLIADDAWQQALDALLILGETPDGLADGPPLPPLPEWVRAQPGTTTRHHLFALHPSIDQAGGPEHADAIIQSAIDRYLDVDPGTLGSWLVRLDRAAVAADILKEATEISHEAFIARIHALIRLDRHNEALELLATPPDASDLVELELTRAAAARMMGDAAAEKTAWDRALNYAAFDQSRNRFIEIAKYATSLGSNRVAQDAWVAAVRVGWGPIPLYGDLRNIVGALASKGRSEDILAISRTLLRFEPQNPELINNFHYLGLLHQMINPRDAIPALDALTGDYPDHPEFRSALALAHIMDTNPEAALAQIAVIRESDRVAPSMVNALEGTALVLSGDEAAGNAMLQNIDWRGFMRAEALAFRRILTRAEFDNLPLPEIGELPPPLDLDDIPAWRRAVERLERDRAEDSLPPLPMPVMPGTEHADHLED